jgi:S-formylglutathione hydrolase FrmB
MGRFVFIPVLAILFLLTPLSAYAGRVDTVEVFSPAMHKNIRCLIILPDDYTITGNPYPVLYLLHGWSGHFASWLSDAPQLKQQADAHQMIIVCPDGGYDSWYLDSPVDSTVRYETHVSKEVVSYIDYYYFTRKDSGGRAISGLSMGGHGAIYLALRHPDVFGAAGSIAGGLDLRPFKKNNWNLERVLGNPLSHWDNWEKHSAVSLIPRLKDSKMPLVIDVGLGDFFLEPNRLMHRLLMEAKYPHEYYERPGEHNAAYWGNAIDYQLVFFDKFFSRK